MVEEAVVIQAATGELMVVMVAERMLLAPMEHLESVFRLSFHLIFNSLEDLADRLVKVVVPLAVAVAATAVMVEKLVAAVVATAVMAETANLMLKATLVNRKVVVAATAVMAVMEVLMAVAVAVAATAVMADVARIAVAGSQTRFIKVFAEVAVVAVTAVVNPHLEATMAGPESLPSGIT